MAHATLPETLGWTAADLVARFGAIPLSRIRLAPPPGTATEQDVIDIDVHEDRLCELVDGTLLEKTMGAYESYLAVAIASLIHGFLDKRPLGVVLGADGMLRLAPGLVRIPDVSFIAWDRLPARNLPREPIWGLAPDLAVEVLSRGNTPEEMRRKLDDYFAAGTRLVWYVDARRREVQVHTSPGQCRIVREADRLDGGDVLPGFALDLRRLFAEPGHEAPPRAGLNPEP